MTHDRRAALRREIELEAAREQRRADRLAATADRPPGPGDVYMFPAPSADPLLGWAVLGGTAADPAALLVVPCDQDPLVGPTDVRAEGADAAAPPVLRCGFPVWLRPDDFRLGDRVDVLPPGAVAAARRVVSEASRGHLDPAPEGADDEDPAHDLLTENLVAAARDLRRWLGARRDARPVEVAVTPIAATLDDLARAARPARDSGVAAFALGADSGGPAGEIGEAARKTLRLSELDHQRAGEPPRGAVLPAGLPGTLVVLARSGQLTLQYYPAAGESPPDVDAGAEGGEWHPSPTGLTFVWSRPFPLESGQAIVRLRPAGPEFVVRES